MKMKEKDGIRGLVPSRFAGAKDKVYTDYLDALNPRGNEVMQKALALCPDIRFQEFLDRIMRPSYLKVNLATIAKGCGIDLMEFNNWWQKSATQRAIATAQVNAPVIVQDMLDDARNAPTVCDRCDGLGTVAAPPDLGDDIPGYKKTREARDGMEAIYIRTCPKCKGEGTVTKSGDTHSRDRLLEMAGITQKGGGASVVINNYSGASHASALSGLNEAMTLDVEAEHVDEDVDSDPGNISSI